MTANIAFNLYQQTIELVKNQRKLFLELGYVLSQIKKNDLYKEIGDGGFNTWRSFLANPEINITPSTADVYIKVYEFYIEKLNMTKDEVLLIPLNRLSMMKFKLEGMNETERGELIEKAKTLSAGDFKIELVDNGIEHKRAINVTRCGVCNKLVIKYDPEQVCSCSGGVDITPYGL